MPILQHIAVFTDTSSRKSEFVRNLREGRVPEPLTFLSGLRGGLFSNSEIAAFIEEESRHDRSVLNPEPIRELRTYSSGERKKALLSYLLEQKPDYLVLDDPFDNLDRQTQASLRSEFIKLSDSILLVQMVGRASDRLPCMEQSAFLDGADLQGFPDYRPAADPESDNMYQGNIPPPPPGLTGWPDTLVSFQEVSVSYGDSAVLNKVDWEIRSGEFWELRGPNGSGKTTLITLMTGDNPKAYGQDLYLFGARKGSGESVWDIKEHIGYFTPALADRFRGYHSVLNMIISGLMDSIGLYVQPGDQQRQLAEAWIRLIGMEQLAGERFCDLTAGQQRLVFCARAMIKHPPLLILDEVTAGLDDPAAALVVQLINKMASESRTAVVFVSHRAETGLRAKRIFQLHPGPDGSTGTVLPGDR